MSEFPDIELVFVSGPVDSDCWTHQYRYFSRNSTVEVVGGQNFSETVTKLETLLDSSKFQHTVLVGGGLGNYAVQDLENRKEVMSTVLTGPLESFPYMPEKFYNAVSGVWKKPKIMKKVFFSSNTNYQVVREFTGLNTPTYSDIESFKLGSLEVPLKNSLVMYNRKCRFSRAGTIERLKPNCEVALIDAGTFSFFERPQEFNKALADYLRNKKDVLERRETLKAVSKNRSLKEFENSLLVEQ